MTNLPRAKPFNAGTLGAPVIAEVVLAGGTAFGLLPPTPIRAGNEHRAAGASPMRGISDAWLKRAATCSP